MAARWRGGLLHALLAGGAVAYTTHPTAARISAFVDTIDKAGPKLPQMEQMKETECPRCGSAKGGAANCCSGDGAWAGKCSMVAGEMEHTWAEGFAACIGAATQQQQAVLNASDALGAETPGGIHEYPGELSRPLQKASEAIAAGLAGSYDNAVAGTEPEECADENLEQCPLWAQKGECEANQAYMRTSCRLSCGQCYSRKSEDSKTSALRRKEGGPSPLPSPSPAAATAGAVSSPSPLAQTEAAQATAAAASKDQAAVAAPAQAAEAPKLKEVAVDAERSAQPKVAQEEPVDRYNKTAPENNASPPAKPKEEDPAHGDVKHANEYALAERQRLVREQAAREAAATAEKVKAESLMTKEEKDALDRSEYQAAIANALASAKVATRDPGDRMEVWEAAINKAVQKKEAASTGAAKAETLAPGQLRSPTKEEAASAATTQASQSAEAGAKEGVAEVRPFESKTAQFAAIASSSAETRPGEKDAVAQASDAPKAAVWMPPGTPVVPAGTSSEAQTAPAETKAAPFAAFATAHAAARELCKGKQGECLSQSA